MRLSLRLQTLASYIPKEANVIDVGCDHGLLDIFLALTRKNIWIQATDISPTSIKYALKSAQKHGVEKQIEFSVKDGLTGINLKDEWIVLSGMGTHTILSILENVDLKDATLLISAHTNLPLLRKKMQDRGYIITRETAIFDGKWYVIMVFQKGTFSYKEEDIILGPYAKENKKYIQHLYKKEKIIIQKKGEETPLWKVLQDKL